MQGRQQKVSALLVFDVLKFYIWAVGTSFGVSVCCWTSFSVETQHTYGLMCCWSEKYVHLQSIMHTHTFKAHLQLLQTFAVASIISRPFFQSLLGQVRFLWINHTFQGRLFQNLPIVLFVFSVLWPIEVRWRDRHCGYHPHQDPCPLLQGHQMKPAKIPKFQKDVLLLSWSVWAARNKTVFANN